MKNKYEVEMYNNLSRLHRTGGDCEFYMDDECNDCGYCDLYIKMEGNGSLMKFFSEY